MSFFCKGGFNLIKCIATILQVIFFRQLDIIYFTIARVFKNYNLSPYFLLKPYFRVFGTDVISIIDLLSHTFRRMKELSSPFSSRFNNKLSWFTLWCGPVQVVGHIQEKICTWLVSLKNFQYILGGQQQWHRCWPYHINILPIDKYKCILNRNRTT